MASILIIDDDPTIRMMFARALKGLGEVETAGNGAEGLRLLGARKYGVILLDLHMPVIDGFVLLQTLSDKQGPNHETPVYVITADNSEQARLRALRRHALFFLTKPVPLAMLTSLVDATLKKAAARAAAAEADGEIEPRPPSSGTAATPAPHPEATRAAGRMTPPIRPASSAPLPPSSKKPGS